MVTLLAESKTMLSEEKPVLESVFEDHTPALEEMADHTMDFIRNLSVNEISELLGISSQLAMKSVGYAYEFPNKKMGYGAIYGFTGEAFKALDVSTISKEALDFANDNLRIISSLYGILKPDDIIKPYRLEFNKNCAPNNQNIAKYLKPKITIEFVKFLRSQKVKDVIDLLPADADACLDWKIIRSVSKVHKINFKTLDNSGKLKTPLTKHLKESRGKMARFILENSIQSFSDLIKAESEDFFYSPNDSKPGLPVFLV